MKLSTQISLGFLIAISIDLLDSYINYSLTVKVNSDTKILTHSETTIRNSGKLRAGIINMQSAFRGYLLTADEQYLIPYRDGLKTLPLLIDEERPVAATSSQLSLLDSIMLLHNLWVDRANSLINAKRQANLNPDSAGRYQYLFQTQFKDQVGLGYISRIENIFDSLDQNEYKLRNEMRNALSNSIKATERTSVIFSILIIIIGTGLAYYLVTKISIRISSMVKLAENISRGNFTKVVDEKKDELSSLSVSLNFMSEKLSQNFNELQKKNDELDQFAYVVSHDLKAPIRGISNVIQWIEEDLPDEISEKMKEYLDIIPKRIKRIESLIDGLLEYARVGRERSPNEDVDVALLLNEIAELIIPKDYKFSTSGLPKLMTDRLHLTQVFSNLVSNAVKYSPPEGGAIAIFCIEKGDYYEFTVNDNGPGIKQEYHDKIFVIFQTLREKNDKESTGIGLAIVKKIIEDKHCSIKVISSEGGGASFIFTWPKN